MNAVIAVWFYGDDEEFYPLVRVKRAGRDRFHRCVTQASLRRLADCVNGIIEKSVKVHYDGIEVYFEE